MLAGASAAIGNETWTPLRQEHLTDAIDLLADEISGIYERVDEQRTRGVQP